MKKLPLLAMMAIWSLGLSASTKNIVRFDLTLPVKKFLKLNEFDVTGVNYDTMEIEALLNENELSQIQKLGTKIKFVYPQNLVGAPDDQYKKPEDIERFVKDVQLRFPEIVEVRSIGKSLEGRDIWAVKITGNNGKVKPTFLVNAMHHAREVMTPEITTDMIDYLTSNYGVDPKVTSWVDHSIIWVIPMFNVDGNNKMWSEDSMWRKNTRNGHGVDINRNYPTGWGSCNGSSARTGAQDYRGEAPASEPETKAMMDFVSEIKPVFNISYHSYSELVIYPYGCRPQRTPAEEAVESIGREMAKAIDYRPGTAWELLYNADGGDIDWMYHEHQVIPYVIEVNSTFAGFHPSYSKWRNKTVERNRPGWQLLLDKLQGPSLQGKVKKGEFSQILIKKSGEEKVSQTYKINPDGSYFIILKPGKYDVTFEGKGKKTFSNLNLTGKKTL